MEGIQALLQSLLHIEQNTRVCSELANNFVQSHAKPYFLNEATRLAFGESNLMDSREVMQYLQISRSTFFRLKKKGLLPYCRIGGRDYFIRTALAEVMERHIRKMSS